MKPIHFIALLTLLFASCQKQKRNKIEEKKDDNARITPVELSPLRKLFMLGQFTEDSIPDTLLQHIFSRKQNSEIIYAPSPFLNEWDTVMNWFYEQDASIFLTLNNNQADTLFLGMGHGLYCLLNLGDLNADKFDEIALVIDYLDESRLNTCMIFSLCNHKWILLKEINIHEGSFDFLAERSPVFHEIPEFLVKKDGIWKFKDYLDDQINSEQPFEPMKTLTIPKCQNKD